jgi:hypothetical protein
MSSGSKAVKVPVEGSFSSALARDLRDASKPPVIRTFAVREQGRGVKHARLVMLAAAVIVSGPETALSLPTPEVNDKGRCQS